MREKQGTGKTNRVDGRGRQRAARSRAHHQPRAGANLYRFIRLVLGEDPSDREIARRWRIDEKNLRELKGNRSPAPKIHRLAELAAILGIDRHDLFEVALGTPAEVVHGELTRRREALARIASDPAAHGGMNGRHDLLLRSLNSAAAIAHRSLDPDEAIRFVSSELKSFGIETHLFLFEDGNRSARIAHSSYPDGLLKAAERLARLRLEDFRIPVANVVGFNEILRNRQTYFYPEAATLMGEMLATSRLDKLIGYFGRLFGIHEVILAPLVSDSRVIGVLAAGSGAIRESDAPAILGFAHHISTALQNAHLYQRLRVSEERLRQLLDSLPHGVFRADSAGRIVSINRPGARLLGFDDPDEVIGRDALSLVDPREVRLLRRNERKKDVPPVFRGTIRRWDGSTIALEASWILENAMGETTAHRTGLFYEIGKGKRAHAPRPRADLN